MTRGWSFDGAAVATQMMHEQTTIFKGFNSHLHHIYYISVSHTSLCSQLLHCTREHDLNVYSTTYNTNMYSTTYSTNIHTYRITITH